MGGQKWLWVIGYGLLRTIINLLKKEYRITAERKTISSVKGNKWLANCSPSFFYQLFELTINSTLSTINFFSLWREISFSALRFKYIFSLLKVVSSHSEWQCDLALDVKSSLL